MRFSIDNWAAWSACLTTRQEWEKWLRQPNELRGDYGAASLPEMPAALRRRAELAGRAALQVAYWIESAEELMIFASRYGEIERSVLMLKQLAMNEALSPTAFSMSVHNAIAALYSIACQKKNGYTAIAAGEETIEAAFFEALGLLAEGEPQVTVVYYEAPLPDIYQIFQPNNSACYAWACRLKLAKSAGYHIQAISKNVGMNTDDSLPDGLRIFHFLASAQQEKLLHHVGGRNWLWSKVSS